jgi:hypothetical protein
MEREKETETKTEKETEIDIIDWDDGHRPGATTTGTKVNLLTSTSPFLAHSFVPFLSFQTFD